MFRSFQMIREFCCSLLKLLHIHDIVRFCEQGVVAAYHVVYESVVESVVGWVCVPHYTAYDVHLANYTLQQIPTQHDMLPQHLVYRNELNREYVITLARNDKTP